ncbi:hypothetical protein ATK36_0765 [Amycolatopsis sulphurea]|uniref:Uncharacterized protein n=1 Tax=Amycolatopsis sulphurea TaxID=76022 RepID=A0A2A9G2S3_9PSEU|nr:hypothetical protein [Amycolatopsis sulphurea]PFG57201.1 hypothetical protein ATK36_0765 [Amycolatopsis sulphurea]
MGKILEHQDRLDRKTEQLRVRPGFRERVEEFMRDQWREPVVALRLSDDKLYFDVPGRRRDGTAAGQRVVRRFFWNILRGVGRAAVVVFALMNSDGSTGGTKGERKADVQGPANAMALDLVDRLRKLDGPWLVFSPSCVAVVDTGSTIIDPADAPPPRIVWQARTPEPPEIKFRARTLTWPDGSRFTFPLYSRTEIQRLRQYRDSLDGRSQT